MQGYFHAAHQRAGNSTENTDHQIFGTSPEHPGLCDRPQLGRGDRIWTACRHDDLRLPQFQWRPGPRHCYLKLTSGRDTRVSWYLLCPDITCLPDTMSGTCVQTPLAEESSRLGSCIPAREYISSGWRRR